ncbi:MAG: LPS export ABC transporter periplasmic protein LptC [Candidatus Malihini olakiniferum]
MKKTKPWLAILLALIVLALIGWNTTNQDHTLQAETHDNAVSTYTSDETTTRVYNLKGDLNYRLVAQKVEYFNVEQLTWLTAPVATLFNEQGIATWSLKADNAKLAKDKILFLYGHVKVKSLTNNSQQLRQIKTDNAQVNLVTQDIASDDEVTLYGVSFLSKGIKMRGNLRNQTIELIKKVKTFYEIQH